MSSPDPFVEVAPRLRSWLDAAPALQATDLLARLQGEYPARYSDKLLRALQRRVRDWRREIARDLVFGAAVPDGTGGANTDAAMIPMAAGEAGQPMDLMDDAGASPTVPQAPPPQLQTTIVLG